MKLQLQSPLKFFKINQKFGLTSNPTYAAQGLKGHSGIDFYATHGTPIYAAHDGLASFQVDADGGHGVVLVTEQEFDYQGGTAFYKTIYWHMVDGLKEPKLTSPIADKTGFVKVKCGDLIGYADNTGISTGDHLHFGLKPVAKGEAWGTWYNTEQNNGYNGAIDAMPYFDLSSMFKTLKAGSKGPEVVDMQLKINMHLNHDIQPDGSFGLKTLQALKTFQKQVGLVEDGICGPRTWERLNT